jgi:enamine deaminase RidA (YjgF/YER057c/UK114 family)
VRDAGEGLLVGRVERVEDDAAYGTQVCGRCQAHDVEAGIGEFGEGVTPVGRVGRANYPAALFTAFVIPDSLEDEIIQVFDNVERTLATVGATWKDVIHVNSYHKVAPEDGAIGADHNTVMAEQFRRRLGGHVPIWTETGVTVLGLAAMRVEIRVTAIVDAGN